MEEKEEKEMMKDMPQVKRKLIFHRVQVFLANIELK